MAELLIKAVDKNMPTLQEYKDTLFSVLVPRAQAFQLSISWTPTDVKLAQKDGDYLWGYQNAKKQKSPTSEQQIIITAYESNPLSDARKLEIIEILRNRGEIIYYDDILQIKRWETDVTILAALRKKDKHSFKRGDIVQVFDDGGIGELHPNCKFYAVRITGVTKQQVEQYVEEHLGLGGEDDLVSARRFWIDIDSIPEPKKAKLLNREKITVSKQNALAYIKDKKP